MTGYRAASTLVGERLGLETALGRTPGGVVEHPDLFRGFLARPDVAAAALLAVADVAGARYADLGQAKRLANLDPVLTANGDRLRVESFSLDNGVHARFDLLPDGIESGDASFGTTNVDINSPLRSALSRVGRSELLHLAVGADELRVSTPSAAFVEREVELPERWVRGFAETPLLAEQLALVAVLRGSAVGRFLGGLPRGGSPGPDLHLAPVRGSLERRLTAVPGSVFLAGAARLRAASRIARFATTLTVLAGPSGVSGWVFDLPGGRLTLLLTAGAYRGFSGEGSLLALLTDPGAETTGRELADVLAWQSTIEPAALARDLGRTTPEVAAGIGWLAAAGRVGYDLAEQSWFHRDLPVDAEAIVRRNPRLTSAARIVADGGVTPDGAGNWQVRSGDHCYRVVARDGRLVCGCAWEHEHHGTRGPCKHVLAVLTTPSRVTS